MIEPTREEKLNKYAKESKKIKYSTRIFENKTNEKPKIVLRELTKEEKRLWTLILKYNTSENIPQEVIMGMLGDTTEKKEKAAEIIKLIIGQIRENVISETGYKNYEELSQYIQNQNIPFKLTMEGTEILTTKSKDDIEIERTCFEDEHGKIENKFNKEMLEQKKRERNAELKEYIQEKQKIEKWIKRKEKILNSLNKEEKQKFLNGEKITEFLKEKDEDIEFKKNITSEYLLEAYKDKNKNENPRMNLLKGYLMIKEKGLAIDTKITLEELESRYYENIKEKNGEISSDDYEKLEILEDYKTFFDLVKTGMDWNARVFALKLKKINFNGLKKLFEKFKSNDEELLNYFNIKEKMIKDVQTDNIEVDYNENNSVKELYEFLLNSSIREKTKKDDEYIISGIYEHIKREIVANNIDEIECYNHYAKKSDVYVCEVPKDKENAKKMDISNTTRQICKNINLSKTYDNEKEIIDQAEK